MSGSTDVLVSAGRPGQAFHRVRPEWPIHTYAASAGPARGQLSFRDKPVAITYSFLRDQDATWLDEHAHTGRHIDPELTLAQHGLTLSSSHVSIETSHCGQFEADRFGIPHRSGVFLVQATEHVGTRDGERPLEFARAEYRGDTVQIRQCSNSEPCWFSV
ncbi:hypothetical protein [Streptomyces winkii]|uniref:hypothetical protein n=1 Tax=Streptomyces winkii TaxID=3051178 RepID=UPI0028D81D0D|nr:hypothetical protein [Streptomyces sp. DSM 40971]